MPVPSRRHRLSVVLAAIALLVLAVTPVRAHAELETATPGADETVEGSPAELVATFTEPLNPDVTSIAVLDAAGEEVAAGGEPGDAPEDWRLPLPELEPGVYEVRWTAESTVDVHLERGTYSFTVAAAPTPSPTTPPTPTAEPSATAGPSPTTTPTPTASPSPSPSAAPTPPTDPAADQSVLIPIVAVLVLVAALGAWLFRRRGR
jgi:methionine-rich copper-binding protein CopC